LQNLVSVFFSVHHHFEIDLNELTFLVIWTAIYNIRYKRHELHRPKRKMRQKIIIFSDVKAPKRLVST